MVFLYLSQSKRLSTLKGMNKMKLYNTNLDKELYYYFNAKNEKRWIFRHRYYDTLGKRRERSRQGFTSENKAYRELLRVRAETLSGNSSMIENENLTVSQWLDIWYETKKNSWAITTRKNRLGNIIGVFKPLLGHYKLSKLDAMTYERVFINKLLEDYQASTVRNFHNVFRIAVNAAVNNGTIAKNNIGNVKVPNIRKKNNNFLSLKELIELKAVAKKHMNIINYTMFLILVGTGMRKGEALGLKWKDIDLNACHIKIRRTRDYLSTRAPKTTNSYRTIFISTEDELYKQLYKYRTWCKKVKLSHGQHLSEDDYVLIGRHSNPISTKMFDYAFKQLFKKTKIKRITIHGLRHTHATLLLNKKISVATVAKRLGNTPEEINRTYGHSDHDADLQAANLFANIINS